MNKKYFHFSIGQRNHQVDCSAQCDLQCAGQIEVFVVGDFYDNDGCHSTADSIAECYVQHRNETYDHLDGTGVVVIRDHVNSKIFVFTDFFGGAVPVFYAQNKDYIFISTDTLFITNHMDKVSLSDSAARNFIKLSMIYGNYTMVEQVKKLATKHYLEVDLKHGKLSSKKCRYTFRKEKETSHKLYSDRIRQCVEQCDTPDTVCTLSKGWDTNFILYHLRNIRKEQNNNNNIPAYIGGGVSGRNEIPEVQKIVDYYGNITLHTLYVDKQSLQNLPEIVYAMQGISYERGVFMHYDLAKKLHADGIKRIFSGDAAHTAGVTGTYTYDWATFKLQVKGYLRHIKYTILNSHDYYRAPYRFGHNICALMSLKKEGQLWNHFGVQGVFPFGRKPFLEMAKSIAVPGVTEKQYHKASFREVAPEGVVSHVVRYGGNTDTNILFDVNTSAALKELVQSFPWFIDRHYPDIDHQLDFYVRILMVDIYRKIFVTKEIDCTKAFPKLNDIYPVFSESK